MHRTIKPRPHHLRDAARIVTVRLVDLRLQHCSHVPGLNTDHRQARFGESAEKPLRQWPGFQPYPLEAVGGVLQRRQQRIPNDLACVIHNADARLFDRNVQSSKRQLARKGSPPPSLRLLQAKLSRNSNQIARGRIRRFESYMPSHAVGLRRRCCPAVGPHLSARNGRPEFDGVDGGTVRAGALAVLAFGDLVRGVTPFWCSRLFRGALVSGPSRQRANC